MHDKCRISLHFFKLRERQRQRADYRICGERTYKKTSARISDFIVEFELNCNCNVIQLHALTTKTNLNNGNDDVNDIPDLMIRLGLYDNVRSTNTRFFFNLISNVLKIEYVDIHT